MKKLALLAILFTGCKLNCIAQADTTASATRTPMLVDQYVGVQLNGLIRQVFNFDNSTSSTNVNPYLLTYNINSRKSGWGLRVGVGYNYSSTASNDGITATTTKLNDLQLRLGIERAFVLSTEKHWKWTAGAGLDLLYNTNNDNTNSTISNSGDTSTTVTKTVGSSYGAGVMGWLRYYIAPRVIIGTEASFYYTTGKQKNTIDITDNQGGFGPPATTETISNPTVSQGIFSSPVVFYLMVKF